MGSERQQEAFVGQREETTIITSARGIVIASKQGSVDGGLGRAQENRLRD